MIDQERLHDLTECYLKSVISEASDSLDPDFDSCAAFGELGIDSFQVLKIIKKLEGDFGTLPKSLLFEKFNIQDLADYFAEKHEKTLSARFAGELQRAVAYTDDRQPRPVAVRQAAAPEAGRDNRIVREAAPILIREKEAFAHPELTDLVQGLYTRYKSEGSVSRGTRLIAANLFIGSARRGYFNYGRSKDIVLLYGYAGPRDYVTVLLEEVYRHCAANDLQLNILSAEQIPSICGMPFSATPFGVLQRIVNLQKFTLDGGPMRRLRYQVSKFKKSGTCRTEEYRCGSNSETDRKIAGVIDRWCESRTVVNPLVHHMRADVLAGALGSEHRLFVTYLDDVLQNVILVTPMCEEENGCLMDLEFYLPDMPLGGLEFAIVEIIERLVREGRDVLSLGGTYGCKLEPSAAADPDVDKILDELRAQNIFNDEGNLQFKNKFRPENKAVFLSRPVGSGNAGNVIDIIMMIADPLRMQTPEEDSPIVSAPRPGVAEVGEERAARPSPASESARAGSSERLLIDGEDRFRILSDAGFNPLNLPPENVDFDLKTDSWAQLHMPAIDAQMRHLHSQLQQPASVDEAVRAVFPFGHFVLTSSGQAAENIFFKAWPRRGVVLQNLLFQSTIFHQIDKGFTPKELPHPALLQLNSPEPYKGDMDWDALQAQVAQDPSAIAFVCIEVGNNASGGHPVSTRHLREVKALLAEHSIPLVIDGTRVVQNAQFLIEREGEHAGKSVWTVVREIFSYADAVIGSLTKELCVNKGGIVATNDPMLFQRLQGLVDEEGAGIDLIEKKLIALSLQKRKHIETKVLQRTEGARLIGRALSERGVPVVHPGGGHCVLIDVRQIPEFKDLKDPVPSFLAWIYLTTGIRAAGHGVGMQKRTRMNDLVRLAVPVGLKRDEIDRMIGRLLAAFEQKADIPEIVVESSAPQPLGGVYAKYRLEKVHNVSGAATREAVPGDAVPAVTRSPQGSVEMRPVRARDVAIVGMAGRYPKAKNVGELWDNLARGRDCIEEIPADRLERRLPYGDSAKYRGGFIDDIDKFDSLFFNISPREAEMLDPQERLFLEVAWEAIEDAGYYPEILARAEDARNIGVFVGAVWAMYQIIGVDELRAGNKMAPNSFLWSIANRVSYWMNLSGPSLTLDTACSSSLTALYLACEAIHAGDCSTAIVGGANLDLHQAKLEINLGGALSPDGVCRTFGKGANGYVAGEGVGALFLKPLDRAVQDGDHVYGVIKSAVVNHGGRTSGYFVPNPRAQTNVIAAALERANVDARSIGYIEAHGTGTELGDPIEIAGLSSAFSTDNVEHQTCAIGSIKTNIGHLEAAAGVVGVSKVLLQMQHRQLVPSLHSTELNEFIDFEHSPFYVVQKAEEWKPKEVDGVGLPLRAGISSFGAGGANAHVILESYEPVARVKEEPVHPAELIFPLSARSEDQLREMAVRLAEFLQQNDVDQSDAAYTLQHGRKSFEHRLAVIAGTKEELIEKLTRFIDGKKDDDVVLGQVKLAESVTRLLNRREKEELIRLLSESRDPHRIAALWAEGLLADWQGFPSSGAVRRISLPTYPFARRAHWVGDPSAVRRALQPSAAMHPMVDSNESTFERQLFKKTFHDRDFFIYDHLVSGIPTLPGVAYLELVRKAGELAAGRPVRRIQNILWVSAITVQNSKPLEVFIELIPSGEAVQFEVFSETDGKKTLHSQGKLLYTNRQDGQPESVDLDAIRARCVKGVDGKDVYPIFDSFGLSLGASFQVLQEVYKNDTEALGALKLPELRQGDLQSMVLHPSLVDGSLQAGMAARLGDGSGEMLVPYSIGEVEILHPLTANCFSYATGATDGKKDSRVLKSNVLILDQTGKVLARIRESTGVPLLDVAKKSKSSADADGVSRLYYSYDWEKAALSVEDASHTPQSILLFDADESLRDVCEAGLRKAEATSVQMIVVRPGESYRKLDEQCYEIDPGSKDDFTRLLEALAERNWPIQDICFAWAAGHADFRDDDLLKKSLERGVSSFLFLCQALIKAKLEGKVQLLYLYSVGAGEVQPHNEAVSGFVNTLRSESPKLVCKTLEVRREDDSREPMFDAVWAELRARTQDAVAIRYEGCERYIRKLKSFDLDEPGESAVLRRNGVYLITGGAGGLGLLFAEFLATQWQARLILTGRSSLSEEREARLEELRKAGAEVLYVQTDVSRREDVENLLNETRSRWGQVNGIIHAAGVVRDSYIRNKTSEEMTAVFAPKIHGTVNLDEAARDEALDFFVVFSSLAAVTGNPGQSDYGFANYFMDSFAAERERLRATGARSGKSLSVNWSLWADGGMRPDEQTELAFKKTVGMWPLSAGTGLDAFVRGLASGRSRFAVVEGIQEKLELAWGVRKKAPPAAAPVSPNQAAVAPIPEERDGSLYPWLQNELSQIVMRLLKLDAGDLSPEKILMDLGFDSIGLTTFANAVNDKFQLDITPVLFFDYPSIDEIAKHLAEERKSDLLRFHRGGDAASQAATPPPATQQPAKAGDAESGQAATFKIRKGWSPAALDGEATPAASGGGFSPELRFVNKPIAIVGMSGVMPQSEDLEEFWENLKGSKDLVTVIPPDRWRWEDYYGDPLKEANKSNSKWGGFMKEVDKFDPLFFGISPREAQMMDPQQRIFLEHVWKAVEDAGHKVSDLSGTRTGVFVGVATNDYLAVMTGQGSVLDGYTASGNSHAVLANRVSFLLGLRGPSAPLDTACSSSLVALHRALESIHTGSCDMALVGGVHVMLTPAGHISFSSAGMLSPEGKCKSFDKSANGYVRGEGCGAIFLKSLAAAEADGNHIYAVIKATAENHGGRVTGMTAPNPSAQAELLIEAYEKGRVDPTTVGFIECHGTGTSLGDPIEIQGLGRAFSELYKRHGKPPAATPHVGLSSVKTNIGHLETAAGIAGILKALLAIKHQQIPANIHLEEINPYISLKGTPFYIANKLTPWEAAVGEDGTPLPRLAGVSSFGFGGANAHIVLEEYIPSMRPSLAQAREPRLVLLSAKNADRLTAYVRSIHAYLEKTEVELIDLAYTLQVGRDEMPERLALVVSSTEDLKHKLQEILQDGNPPNGSYRDSVRKRAAGSQPADGAAGQALIQALIEEKELSRLAELWVSGAQIDWRLLYEPGVPRRVSAPTYPFARERHWIQGGGEDIAGDSHRAAPAEVLLHPLVHRNVSTLREQKFRSRFTGSEFYLADHSTATHAILPAAAYIEMLAAAGELAGEQKVRTIRSMALLTPLTAQGHPIDVEITLTPAGSDIEFAVRTLADGGSTMHSRGKLAYAAVGAPPAVLDLPAIRARCSETAIAGADLYPFLCTSGLIFGKGFQVVQEVIASKSECLAVLRLPEHLRREASQFWLHPALLDGGMHTAIGLMKKNRPDVPWSLPYSVGEVQIFRGLNDVHYVHATWDVGGAGDGSSLIKVNLQFVDRDGACLVRVKDLVAKPFVEAAGRAKPAEVALGKSISQREASLDHLIPVWNPVRPDPSERNVLPESARILLLGSDQAHLDWLRKSYPAAQLLQIVPTWSVELMAQALADCRFDHLLWVAPDVTPGAPRQGPGDEAIIELQEQGVLAAFRIIKALLHLGYANRNLQWTFVTGKTQRVTDAEPIHPAHASIVGLVGSLAKEYPNWDVRLLDLDSLESVSARECLSLPFDKQGDALARRHGEWFQHGFALAATMPEATPAYRRNGAYVVIGGAGGVGEVWSRYLIEHYQANVVWIGRRECNASIEAMISALSSLGPAPLYISADASDPVALERARRTVLDVYPAIHGVVHSAIVLRDQSLSRMDESAFRASLSAKVDISVNVDRVFGNDELDFLLFFSSIISFVKSPGQSNYAAGCTFSDSFAHWLQQQRAYPVKIMNWGYWGNVGVVADESYNRIMRQMGIGSIEPREGLAALEALLGSDLHQLALIKTLNDRVTAGLNLIETIRYYPKAAPMILPQMQRVLSGQASV